MEPDPIRILVADDHAVVRAGIRALLAEFEHLHVVAEAADGGEAERLARELEPDVILMDLVMPVVDGIEAIRRIVATQPDIGILALTSFSADDQVFPALEAGARGYLLKDTQPLELVQAIHQVYRGESSLHPYVARRVLRQLVPAEVPADVSPPLTERENEVLALVAKGLSNGDIARRLHLSVATVRTHVSKILGKLHLTNRVQATLYALRVGLAENAPAEGADGDRRAAAPKPGD